MKQQNKLINFIYEKKVSYMTTEVSYMKPTPLVLLTYRGVPIYII
jgi:hypothetical protein